MRTLLGSEFVWYFLDVDVSLSIGRRGRNHPLRLSSRRASAACLARDISCL